ncbi:DUF5662 family protein [Hominifimenecus microfluidus]|uniref:DUF5662 family protein n=1 Tax=Hominifimenecus microfluidus TaxID=2885348 RepID=A0AAE3EAF6_9FIRM|nr:DUF5662 family protein [Hominifimenecus microfluidus]MCC2231027.1 DUF5662 family protein [Hominifimenecus microfluidus]
MHILAHFKTITHHKLLVMKHCFRAGLYWQGLVHDLSKYMPSEFWVGARYYQGDHSPNDAERKAIGYSSAWMHHKGRNKHHYEYWTDYKIGAPKGTIAPMPMPARYVAEMFCDRLAASQNYNKENFTPQMALDYYLQGKDNMVIHPKSKRQLEGLLRMYVDKGEDYTLRYIRKVFLKKFQVEQPRDLARDSGQRKQTGL